MQRSSGDPRSGVGDTEMIGSEGMREREGVASASVCSADGARSRNRRGQAGHKDLLLREECSDRAAGGMHSHRSQLHCQRALYESRI